MPITQERFDAIKTAWGDYSSWAVWAQRPQGGPVKAGIGDLSVLDPHLNPGLLDLLRPDVVFLGLNASSRGADMQLEPLRNFHDPSTHGRDYRIRDALEGTPYWGGFMTDIIEGYPETDSAIVVRQLRDHPEDVRKQIDRLEEKLAELGSSDPLLIAFGRETHRLAARFLQGRRRLVYVTHYSHQVSPDPYRNSLLAAIAEADALGD